MTTEIEPAATPAKSRKLFEIAPDLLALNELFDADGGELGSPEIEAAFVEWTTTLASEEGKKLDSYCNLIKSLEGEAVVAKAEAEQYLMKVRTRENRVKWLKQRMQVYLEFTGRKKISTATGRVVMIKGNGGVQKLTQVLALDPTNLTSAEIVRCPEEFLVPRTAVNLEAVREVLKAGGSVTYTPVEGEPQSLAKLEPRGSHLEIH